MAGHREAYYAVFQWETGRYSFLNACATNDLSQSAPYRHLSSFQQTPPDSQIHSANPPTADSHQIQSPHIAFEVLSQVQVMGMTDAHSEKLQSSSRSVSPEAIDSSSLTSELPDAVQQFFKGVSQEGFPVPSAKKPKSQPWRTHWIGPQQPTEDGKLIVACPKRCTYGSNNLGGY